MAQVLPNGQPPPSPTPEWTDEPDVEAAPTPARAAVEPAPAAAKVDAWMTPPRGPNRRVVSMDLGEAGKERLKPDLKKSATLALGQGALIKKLKDNAEQRRGPSLPKRQPTMALSKFVHGHTLTVPGLSPSSVTVKLDTTGQHTFSWYVPIALEDAFDQPLPPGSLNLYLFPTVTLDDGSMITPEGPRLDALKALLKAMVVDDDCTFATKPQS